ncbi:MAG: hypothetical protein PHV59_12405, partial [Victivallales bacterium]|nr:hypothetical protein [Victivallales bacterium]
TMSPSLRYPIITSKGAGAYLSGNDITYEHYYAVRFKIGKEPGLHLTYENTFFTPLTLGVEMKSKQSEQDITLYGSYPLWKKLEPGLSNISPLLEIRYDEPAKATQRATNTRKEIAPGIRIDITYPVWRLNNQFNYVIERESWDSPADRNSMELWSIFSHYLGSPINSPENGSELTAISYLFSDKDNIDIRELEIRGYREEDALKTRRGGTFALDYSFPILKERSGWWNPNIYWEDIALAAFAETAFGEGNKPIYSSGVECRFEAALGFYIKFIPVVGVAFPRQGRTETYIALMFSSQGLQNSRNRLNFK